MVFLLLKKVLSASSYGHFTAAKDFWSECHIFRFGNNRRSSRRGLLGGSNCILLRSARPPTHLHAAQFLRSAAYSRRNFLAAQFLFFLANRGGPRGGPRAPFKGPRAKGPKGPKGPSGPLGIWAKGPFGPLGPLRGPGGPLVRNKRYP